MPNLSGLEAVHLIKEAVPQTQVVVLSMHKREAFVHQVLASGALGYVIQGLAQLGYPGGDQSGPAG